MCLAARIASPVQVLTATKAKLPLSFLTTEVRAPLGSPGLALSSSSRRWAITSLSVSLVNL